ncbi:PIN domain-containing protein [Candidatus Micrarchaeota archaeon]|nr:PIN domain-containing protein [Candidatus Micrarchaeota archaeon]MBU1166654.1 PIN domain-containing protein [Candidatus Micrarchaeota archaeon]MBU1886611.1 PIN domain-containing protein [Candidatus Micrarchaeota archaeon]
MPGGNNIIYDTSALLEFFQGSASGFEVKKSFEDEETENNIPAVVLCELISKLKRAKVDFYDFVSALEKNAVILALDKEIAKEAGTLHAELKEKEPQISMIDCVIMAHANMLEATIISKDRHFKLYKNAKII